jgi:nucleotide-binding universal stress UspA family protein
VQNLSLSSAIEDFRRARRRAMVKEILARLRGENVKLLSFEDVRSKLRASSGQERGLQDVPLNAIIGSLNRYDDFTRDFLPKKNVVPERWAQVEVAINTMAGLDPIEVYQIGEVYFVKDGNHRVSVAHQTGASHIHAYVTEIKTRVPLDSDANPDDLILKAEYAEFLEHTGVDKILPEADLTVSASGQYRLLEEHIEVHRYYMGIDWQRDISLQEAVKHWYEAVYLPIQEIIWAKGILREFPGRTSADMYLWISEHRALLEEELGRYIRPDLAARDLTQQFSPRPGRVAQRLSQRLIDSVVPDPLETGPSPGSLRKEKQVNGLVDHLFEDILVALPNRPGGWMALEQAFEVARRERGRITGLHVYDPEINQEPPLAVQEEFYSRCQAAGVEGQFVFSTGDISTQVRQQARWADLLILNLAFPPATQPLAALNSGFRKIVQRCPCPILAAPQEHQGSRFTRLLLAYDGNPKADEALFVATYLSGKWQVPLVVLTVQEKSVKPDILMKGLHYLEQHGIEAESVFETGPVAERILHIAQKRNCNLLLMGGYGRNPVKEVVLGNTVDQVLRASERPVLICR